MAQGWARHLKGELTSLYCASTVTHGVNPLAAMARAEAGPDTPNQRSKHMRDETRRSVQGLPETLGS